MRITFDIPDDVYQAVHSMAAARGVSLEEAIVDLARLGLAESPLIDGTKPFPCFAVTKPVPPITLEQTLAAEDEP
ncbi:MAG: hypothetical protein NT090_04830 [Acidobacteria bacterium]|nr:hypothetical protein [Acidobacteriota bacterium]